MATVTPDDIANGLRDQEFLLHYQPKVSLTNNRIIGAKALARWRRSDGTLLLPADFLPTVGNGALLGQFSSAMLQTLLRDLAAVGVGRTCVSP